MQTHQFTKGQPQRLTYNFDFNLFYVKQLKLGKTAKL